MRSFRSLALLAAAALAACGPQRMEEDVTRPDATRPEAGMDVQQVEDSAGPDVTVPGERCLNDSECDDGVYCNGRERCSAGVCVGGTAPCEDGASCTMNACDEENDRCVITADDSVCGDSNACNGVERCNPRGVGADPRTGCMPVRPQNLIDCDDGNTCTIDSCDPMAGCVHSPRDLDGDGFIDRACTSDGLPTGMAGTDCNDSDPLVYPGAREDCFDGRDNNCNGQADFFDVAAGCRATNDTCETARLLPGPGTYNVALTGATNQHTLSCNPTTANDLVFRFRLEAAQDVRVTMASSDAGSAIAVASTCDPTMFRERSCGRVTTAAGMTATPAIFLRALPAGEYFLILEAAGAGPYRFSLRFDAPTMFPAGDACPPASPPAELALGAGMPGAPSMVTPAMLGDDFSLSCNPGLPRPDGVLRFTLTENRNVDLTVTSAGGQNFVSVRSRGGPTGSCPGTQIRCQATPSGAAFTVGMRDLPPDEYYVIVENSADLPVTLTAQSSDPAMRVPGDACRSAVNVSIPPTRPATVSATINNYSSFLIDADHGTSSTCGSRGMPSGWRDGVFTFALTEETDARITVRPTAGWSPTFAWALQGTCGNPGTAIGRCNTSSAQAVYTGLAAGMYGLVVETQTAPPPGAGFTVEIIATSPSARAREEACSGAVIALSPSGASLTGTVSFNPMVTMLNPNPDHGTGCGSGGAPGFTDVVYAFTIPDSRNVSVELVPTGFTPWYFEVQDRCGAVAPAGRCREGLPRPVPSVPSPQWTGRLAAGTYFIVAETVTSLRGAATINVTAAP
jgi:hypothetical protein